MEHSDGFSGKIGRTVHDSSAAWTKPESNLKRKPNIVMIVLDTIRSDHLSICGYERPTTPVLEDLVRQAQAATCDAYAPGTWTLPSHASFFTGLSVPDHGAHFGPDGRRMLWDVTVHHASRDF